MWMIGSNGLWVSTNIAEDSEDNTFLVDNL